MKNEEYQRHSIVIVILTPDVIILSRSMTVYDLVKLIFGNSAPLHDAKYKIFFEIKSRGEKCKEKIDIYEGMCKFHGKCDDISCKFS